MEIPTGLDTTGAALDWPGGFPIIRPGARVRVTHLDHMRNFPGGPIDYDRGTVVEGVVQNVDLDGFFDLYTDFGTAHGYYVNDPTLRVEVVNQ